MATEKDFAALSALVRNPRSRNPASAGGLLPPPGWSALADIRSENPQPGFDVRTFVQEQGDLVLAVAGPDFIPEALAASKDAEEFVTNLALDMGLASYTAVLLGAAQAYGRLRQRACRDGTDPSRIHFTGHGVGGGIAAVLASWFDQPCTVFAQAPMRAVALAPGDFASALHTMEVLLGHADGAVKALQGFCRHPREVLAQREQLRVTHWHVRGEVYTLLRSQATSIQGTEHAIDIGIQPPTLNMSLTLHDMKLHAALLYDPRLSLLCQDSPELLSLLMDREMDGDLIDTLIEDQHRVGLDGASALQRFVSGLEWKADVSAAGTMSRAATR